MSGACPLRQETALKPCVDKTFLHLDIHLGIDKVQKREKAAESIPESRYYLAFGIDFREIAREEHRPVEAGVECPDVVEIVVLDGDAPEGAVPAFAAFFSDSIE